MHIDFYVNGWCSSAECDGKLDLFGFWYFNFLFFPFVFPIWIERVAYIGEFPVTKQNRFFSLWIREKLNRNKENDWIIIIHLMSKPALRSMITEIDSRNEKEKGETMTSHTPAQDNTLAAVFINNSIGHSWICMQWTFASSGLFVGHIYRETNLSFFHFDKSTKSIIKVNMKNKNVRSKDQKLLFISFDLCATKRAFNYTKRSEPNDDDWKINCNGKSLSRDILTWTIKRLEGKREKKKMRKKNCFATKAIYALFLCRKYSHSTFEANWWRSILCKTSRKMPLI